MTMHDRGGFTVVEVIIAILVLSVGVLGLASTAALTTRMISMGYRYSEASTVVAQQFEILRSRPCDQIVAGTRTTGIYELSWTVDEVAGRSPGRRINLEVTYPGSGGPARTDPFTTFVVCEIV